MGFALGVGAHLQELRRTRSGSFEEKDTHTLQEIQEAQQAALQGDPTGMQSLILPPSSAVMDLPRVILRDRAVDAVCHGAVLARMGVMDFSDFRRGELVAIFTRKEELVGLGTALVDSALFPGLSSGLVISPRVLVMERGTYPRGWRMKSG
jgi:tRNA pseudouridine55 synthase/H/ACA ribonucleoprotein complex subunit 4